MGLLNQLLPCCYSDHDALDGDVECRIIGGGDDEDDDVYDDDDDDDDEDGDDDDDVECRILVFRGVEPSLLPRQQS